MGKEIIIFGDIELEKHKFGRYKTPIFLEDVDIKRVLLFNKISSGEKNYEYFTDYLHDDFKVKPLYIMLPETSSYVKSYHGQTKLMYFLVEDDDLLEKHIIIWDKVSTGIKTEFGSKPVYNKIYLKTKLKS